MMTDNRAIMVLPLRPTLDALGRIWEYLLMVRGWNDLPPAQKSGRIVAFYQDGTVDVRFDAIDHVARAVFQDELRLLT